MVMSLSQYIINPMGKSNAVLNVTAREAIRNSYKKKYDVTMLREHGNMQYTLYKDEKNNVFIAHFKVPSETIKRFYYDVVFEFSANADIEEAGTNLFKYNCRYFSNDPAFVYTYAHVFHTNDLMIEMLRSKMSKKAIKKKPEEKNPTHNIGYVKAIYFAYLYMSARQLYDINTFKAAAVVLSKRNLLANIEEADVKIQKRQEAGEKLKAELAKKKTKKETIANSKPEIAKINKTISGKVNGKMGNVNKVNKITRKRSNFTKK
jgi:hypothetical protein